jgi:ParB-like chromosome segregation protein Spo0J
VSVQPNFGKDLGIHQIDPNKIKLADDPITTDKPFRNPRTHLSTEEMATKRESIRTLGILKPPLVRPIQPDADGNTHQMIAGSLRLRSVLKLLDENSECYNSETAEWQPAGVVYKTIKCNVRECDEETAIRISIAENLEHTQVPELDLMEYCQELVELQGANGPKYTRTQIAGLCNRSESWVSLTLQLNELAPAYKKLMNEGRLSRTGAISMILGTSKDQFGTVIEKCKDVVRQEAAAEEQEAVEEEQTALSDLEDAEIDMGIHEMQKDDQAHEAAKRRFKSATRRVSVASDKRKAATKKAEEGVITADTVNKVIMTIPGAKKGKAKPLTAKVIRELHTQFSEYLVKCDDTTLEQKLAARTGIAVVEVILGKRTTDTLDKLIANEKLRLDEIPECVPLCEPAVEEEIDPE